VFKHISVLLEACIEGLAVQPKGIYVDGTLGGAGHGMAICSLLSKEGRFIGIDQDEEAIKFSQEKLANCDTTVDVIRSNYQSFDKIMDDLGVEEVDGILLDLGVSSFQLDTASRGFSYMKEAPLDMRMDQRNVITAATIVNTYSYKELVNVLKAYGEEKFANNIVKHILAAREVKLIETTTELVEIIQASIPMKLQKKMGHPAKKTFQAIRIELNKELQVLRDTLQGMIDRLAPNGRLCVITFHSLEDRIVKKLFRKNEYPCTCPREFPICICGNEPTGKMVPRKPILPSKEEMERNSRSRSAKLRIFIKKGGDLDEKSL